MTDAYPSIEDWDRTALDTLPSQARAGDGAAWCLGLVDGLADVDSGVEGLARELSDVEIAGSYVLEALASRHGVAPRGGMDVELYRRLVAGAMASLPVRRVRSWDRLTAMWQALTGSTDVLVRRIPVEGLPAVKLDARITFEPTRAWLVAAGRIVASAVDTAVEWEARVYLGGSGVWGEPAWSTSAWAYDILGGP